MTSPEMKKAPAATGAINTETSSKRNESVKTSLPQPEGFSTRFELPSLTVGNIAVRAGHLVGNNEPDQPIVVLDVPARDAALTAAQALSLAASLQAVSVFLLEAEPRTVTRKTEPGSPSFEEAI